jgi:hypothetical protein
VDKLSRRSMLRRSSGLTGAAAVLLPLANSRAQEKRAEPAGPWLSLLIKDTTWLP